MDYEGVSSDEGHFLRKRQNAEKINPDPLVGDALVAFHKRLHVFQEEIGYRFRRQETLIRALTSASYSNATRRQIPDKGDMEKDGDKILRNEVTKWVKQHCGKLPNSKKSWISSFLNSNAYLSMAGMRFEIDQCVRISESKLKSQNSAEEKIRMTADFVESLIKAIHYDGGNRALGIFFKKHILPPPNEGSLSYPALLMTSDNLEEVQEGLALYIQNHASLELTKRRGRKYKGDPRQFSATISLSRPPKKTPPIEANSEYPNGATTKAIMRFFKTHPWALWGFEGEVSLLLPTVIPDIRDPRKVTNRQ